MKRPVPTPHIPAWSALALCAAVVLATLFAPTIGSARTVTDMAGRVVEAPERATRIVTTYKPASLCLAALGLMDRLAGIDTDSKFDDLQSGLRPQLRKLPGVGRKSTGLNLETILSVQPDLVILYSQKDGRQIAERLREYGICAVIIEPETFEGLFAALRLIATAAGEPQRAERAIAECERVLGLVRDRVDEIPATARRSVYFAAPHDFFATATGDLLQDDIITRAGGRNVGHELSGFFHEISPEQFMLWNPDLVAVSAHARRKAAEALAGAQFAQVSAVVSGQVYGFPSELAPWDFPSPLSALGVLWLAKRLYPERMADVDLMTEIDRFHATLFGRSFTDLEGRLDDGTDG
ncbi:iron complex transport system substrate-binding protein [Desulfobaculum xiamenense]|uniref:Iron complex transport system substrate-binding protein n=1 Tax=Desulfobaculum xiamenense TaxID=995050 RepID=A0A846QTP5_9BACT|nr:ABC transporter substrate-binding protein [Desulfobaculum xiamenense]NJB68544.1 iron complex transport system substrate-binding protein [Desulfobaculum xiamenense]